MISEIASPDPRLTPRPRTVSARTWVIAALILAVLVWAFSGIEISLSRMLRGIPQVFTLLKSMLAPPDWSYLPTVGEKLLESLQIAALGTAVASLLALPFGVLAARTVWPVTAISTGGKVILNAVRTFPELVLALIFINAVGPGAFAGVLAVSLHSIGMLGKLYAERIETVDKDTLEALSAAGASSTELFRYGILPEVLPDFLSFALYRFDLNVRAAAVLGLVGAGGIGTLIQLNIGTDWPKVGTILLGVMVTVGIVDYVSGRLRNSLA